MANHEKSSTDEEILRNYPGCVLSTRNHQRVLELLTESGIEDAITLKELLKTLKRDHQHYISQIGLKKKLFGLLTHYLQLVHKRVLEASTVGWGPVWRKVFQPGNQAILEELCNILDEWHFEWVTIRQMTEETDGLDPEPRLDVLRSCRDEAGNLRGDDKALADKLFEVCNALQATLPKDLLSRMELFKKRITVLQNAEIALYEVGKKSLAEKIIHYRGKLETIFDSFGEEEELSRKARKVHKEAVDVFLEMQLQHYAAPFHAGNESGHYYRLSGKSNQDFSYVAANQGKELRFNSISPNAHQKRDPSVMLATAFHWVQSLPSEQELTLEINAPTIKEVVELYQRVLVFNGTPLNRHIKVTQVRVCHLDGKTETFGTSEMDSLIEGCRRTPFL